MWAMIGVVVGAGVYYAVPKVYEARAVIQVVPPRVPEGFLKARVTAGLDQRLNGMVHWILTRSRLEALVTEFNLYEDERNDMPMEDVVEKMRNDITARVNDQDERDGSFSVSFSYVDAESAMRVTAKLAQLFIDESLTLRDVATQGFSQFIDSQLEETRLRLDEMESTLREWPTKHHQRPPQELVIENEILQERYKTILRESYASQMEIALETRQIGEQFRLIESARLPEHPIGPLLYPFLIVGAVGGIACRLLLRLASSLWRRRRMQAALASA